MNYETSSGSWVYDNNSSYASTYGRLYDWETANNVCPSGWHLPSDDEWKQLEMYLGMSQSDADNTGWRGTDEGGKLKETGTTLWKSPNTGATNESFFTAVPGGYRGYRNGGFYDVGNGGYWWSATEGGTNDAWSRILYYSRIDVYRYDGYKRYGFSVRCLRD